MCDGSPFSDPLLLDRLRSGLSDAIGWCEGVVLAELPSRWWRREIAPSLLAWSELGLVESVVTRRRSLLTSKALQAQAMVHDPPRIICYWPQRESGDMLAATELPAFFENDTCPPWDTWMGLIRVDTEPCLLGYVPGSLHAGVDQVIACCTTYQVEWASKETVQRIASLARVP